MLLLVLATERYTLGEKDYIRPKPLVLLVCYKPFCLINVVI